MNVTMKSVGAVLGLLAGALGIYSTLHGLEAERKKDVQATQDAAVQRAVEHQKKDAALERRLIRDEQQQATDEAALRMLVSQQNSKIQSLINTMLIVKASREDIVSYDSIPKATAYEAIPNVAIGKKVKTAEFSVDAPAVPH